MHGDDRPAWFVGDLNDPWVAAIADRLPDDVRRHSCPGELPEAWIGESPSPGLVVLHRPILTALDAQRIARLRSRGDMPCRTVLCAGPYIRHDDFVRWARLFDVVLPEATAAETIRRHVAPEPRATAHIQRPTIGVISGLHDIRKVLVDLCRGAGYRAEAMGDAAEIAPRGVVLWDVPTLDPNWPERLARRARAAAVVALLGFADRAIVARAREAGASACLDWPCDLDDLAFVLDRVARLPRAGIVEPGHVLPPPPVGLRRQSRPEVAEPGRST